MRFNGGDCSQSFNIQEADKFDCSDFVPGVPISGQAWIWVHKRGDESEKYFEGWVGVGEEFPLRCDPNDDCSSGKISADSTVNIYLGENRVTLVQLANFHTSCSQNLFLKDRFGGVQLVLFINGVQGEVSCFLQVNFGYTLTNEGSAYNAEIVEFFSIRNSEFIDLMDYLPDNVIEPGSSIVVQEPVLLDMTVRQTYTTITTVVGETPGGNTCNDDYTLIFVAGNPLPPGFPSP